MTRPPIALTQLTAGINRLRVKGSPEPTSLYDLVNGYVTLAGTAESRPGTLSDAQLEPGTKGLCAFEGKLHVFSDQPREVPEGYVCVVLIHPSDPDATLVAIHFAKPFLGALYVVAEWSDDPSRAWHYWLQQAEVWKPNHVYLEGAVVAPTVPNGYAYVAGRLGAPAPLWAPNVAREVGDQIEPTVHNGYLYTAIETFGADPRSGPSEPTWASTEGGITYEDADNSGTGTSTGDGSGPPPVPPRYGGGGGDPRGGNFDTEVQ